MVDSARKTKVCTQKRDRRYLPFCHHLHLPFALQDLNGPLPAEWQMAKTIFKPADSNGEWKMAKTNFKPEVKIPMANGECQMVNLPFAIQYWNQPPPGEWQMAKSILNLQILMVNGKWQRRNGKNEF